MEDKFNEFELICMELEAKKCCRKCKRNKYVCAKGVLQQRVGKDIEKLLMIKAETIDGDYTQFASLMFSLTAVGTSFI